MSENFDVVAKHGFSFQTPMACDADLVDLLQDVFHAKVFMVCNHGSSFFSFLRKLLIVSVIVELIIRELGKSWNL